jgi:hypothetical protein
MVSMHRWSSFEKEVETTGVAGLEAGERLVREVSG